MMVPKSRNETSGKATRRRSQRPKTENPVGRRIVEALGDRDLGWLAEKTGIPQNTLGDYVRRGITRADNALLIAQELGVSLDWLIGGMVTAHHLIGGTRALPDDAIVLTAEEHRRFDTDADDLYAVPMDGAAVSAGAGALADAGHQADWMFPLQWLRRSFGQVEGLRLVRVVGDSMEPELSDGDWVMIDRNRTDLRDGLYAVLLDDNLLVKRVQIQGRQVRLVSRNPLYDPIVLEGEEVDDRLRVRGRVVWSSQVQRVA